MPSSAVQTCALDRKSTRLNSSHTIISYAVFCLKKSFPAVSATPTPLTTRPPRAMVSRPAARNQNTATQNEADPGHGTQDATAARHVFFQRMGRPENTPVYPYTPVRQ